MTGIEVVPEILAAAGVPYIFGNPGSTELPLKELLADARFEHLLGPHELPLTAMADGYAMASGKVGVVYVHISRGLGDAMGLLYNAHGSGTRLLLLAGQQDRRWRFEEPALAGDTAAVARPWTKWGFEVQRSEDLAAAVRRAIQTALALPTGPVFLSTAVDLQLESVDQADLRAPYRPDRRIRPPRDALQSIER